MNLKPCWPRAAIIPTTQAIWTNIPAVVATNPAIMHTVPIIRTRLRAIGATIPANWAIQDTIPVHLGHIECKLSVTQIGRDRGGGAIASTPNK